MKTPPPLPDISVIIPTLNEEKALPATLQALARQYGWKDAWIVDGGSTDDTPKIVRMYADIDPRIHGITAPCGRGCQMNAGAHHATGNVLLFLHADTVLTGDCLYKLRISLADRRLRAGCFTHRFSEADFPLKLISILHNWRFDLTRIAYGDQALFVERRLFWQIGGFPETALEDIRFGEILRRVTRPWRLKAKVVTDSRKFRELGTWRAAACVLHILLNDKLGRVPQSRFFKNIR